MCKQFVCHFFDTYRSLPIMGEHFFSNNKILFLIVNTEKIIH
jgi:hypothetical protein